MCYSYTIKLNDKFANIRDVLKSHFLVSTRLLNKLKNFNLIYLNNVPVAPNKPVLLQKSSSAIFINNIPVTLDSPVLPGDKVSFSMDLDADSSNIISVRMNLDIVYEY